MIENAHYDTEHFGFSVARGRVATIDEAARLLDEASEADVRLLIARCESTRLDVVQHLLRQGCLLTDTLVYFKTRLKQALDREPKSDLLIRPARDGESDLITDLARRCFTDYRSHYHADPLLDRGKCDEVYARWASGALRDRGPRQEVLVAERAGNVIGFGVVRLNSPDEGEAVLAGVDSSLSGSAGIYFYRALLIEGMRFAHHAGAKWGIASTQLHNTIVQKIWARTGWEPSSSYHTLHYHAGRDC